MLIVDVIVDAGKDKMIIFFTINTPLLFHFSKVILNINHTCCVYTHELCMFQLSILIIVIIIFGKY